MVLRSWSLGLLRLSGIIFARSIILFVVFGCSSALKLCAADFTVMAVSGKEVQLKVGMGEGVRAGMTGRITKQEMAGGQLQSFEIARFRVKAVESASSKAMLTEVGSGWVVEPGMEVVFDQPLVAPEPAVRATPRPSAPTPTPRLPSDPTELDRLATAAFEAQRWERAIELYRALLSIVPNEPLAKKRLQESETKLQAKQRSADEAAGRAAEDARRRDELKTKLANADYLIDKGDQLMKTEEWVLAAEYYRQVAELDPSYREVGARKLLAHCRAALAAEDRATAMRAYDQLMILPFPVDLAAQATGLADRINSPTVMPTPLQATDQTVRGSFFEPAVVDILPMVLTGHPAEWSDQAVRSQLAGVVILQALVTADGKVESVRLLRADHKKFGIPDAAAEAARKYIFKPAKKNGEAVATYGTITIPFRFSGR